LGGESHERIEVLIMKKAIEYIENIQRLVALARETQLDHIRRAAEIMARTIMDGGLVYAFGAGHSHMMAEELFYRAGGMPQIYPILEESLMLHNGAMKSTQLERMEGYAEAILSLLDCTRKDCIIIASNSGRNAVILEMAFGAQARGMKVIALTSLNHSKALESRHKSGKKLYQVADVTLDNLGCLGDASIHIEAIGGNIGATSTSIGAMLLHAVEVAAIEILLEKGVLPDIFSSSNLNEGDEINEKYLEKYKSIIKPL
jgi:uncharacterized phosphosugar-binding protein